MGYMIALAVVALIGAAGASWRALTAEDRRGAPHNDMLRAGQSPDVTPNDAALRAQGKAAWIRMGGF